MSKNNNQSVLDHHIQSLHGQKPSRSTLQGESNQENIFPSQNSHRLNQQNSNGYVGTQMQNSQGNSCEPNSLVEQYKSYTKNFFSRPATGGGPSQQNVVNQNSVLQQPQIIQNGQNENMNLNYNQCGNKENELRSSSYGNSNIGKGTNILNGNTSQYQPINGQYLQNQPNQQNSQKLNQSTTLNKTTTSFLNNASQHMQNTMNAQNSNLQKGYDSQEANQQYSYYNSSHRDYAMRDITNLNHQAQDGHQQANQLISKQSSIYAQQNKRVDSNGNQQNNRIPQASIINSATGNMNQKGCDDSNYQSQPPAKVSLQLGHSKSQIETQVVNNSVKTPIATQSRVPQNPRIIDKKFNLSGINQNQNSGQNSNQPSHRYLSKENPNNSAIVENVRPVNGVQRKSSHGNASSMGNGNNVFKRVRSGVATQGGSSSATGTHGTSRYSQGNINSSSNALKQVQQNIRNIQLGNRLKELTGTGRNGSNEQSHEYINKYARQHQNQERVINKNINKSGENLTSSFQRALHQKNTAQTQRSSAVVSTHGSVVAANNGRNVKNGVSGTSTAMSIASVANMQNQNSSSLKNSVVGRSTISSVTAKLIDQHQEKQNQRNQTKTQSQTHGENQNLKRNKTSEGAYKPSQLHSRGATHSHLQSLIGGQSSTSNHKKSNGSSANDHNSSIGTSHRNSTSQHNTNRSSKPTISKSGGRTQNTDSSKNGMSLIRKKSETNVIMKQESNSGASQKQVQALPPQIISNSAESHDTTNITADTQEQTLKLNQFDQRIKEPSAQPFTLETERPQISVPEQIQQEMENRRKNWLKSYKTKLDLNDVLEIRNPQAVVEFLPEIFQNMLKEQDAHMYPANFLDKSYQDQISEKYRQYLVDWLAELHYKFKMWPETLYVTVGIIDKTLMLWKNFKKSDLQALGITALHIAGKYEEIYPPELKTILQVIDNAVTRDQVCGLESQILQCLDFNMVWPSILRFMQRYSTIANYNKEQQMIAQMLTDFMLLEKALLLKKPSVLGAVAIYATNMITNKSKPWNSNLQQCTGGIKEEEIKPLAKQLFYFIKKLEASSLKTMFRKYELSNYLGVIKVISKIQMPQNQQVQQQHQQQPQAAPPAAQ